MAEQDIYDAEDERWQRYYEELGRRAAEPAPTGPDYVTVNTRCRRLAVTWTNQAQQVVNQDGSTSLVVADPPKPTRWGGINSCEAELAHARQVNQGGTWWRSRLWYGSRPVEGYMMGAALRRAAPTEVLGVIRQAGAAGVVLKLGPEEE